MSHSDALKRIQKLFLYIFFSIFFFASFIIIIISQLLNAYGFKFFRKKIIQLVVLLEDHFVKPFDRFQTVGNRSSITDQILLCLIYPECCAITDHRSPITDSIVSLVFDVTSTSCDHRSSITDHRSPINRQSTHSMYWAVVRSSIIDQKPITDHRSIVSLRI